VTHPQPILPGQQSLPDGVDHRITRGTVDAHMLGSPPILLLRPMAYRLLDQARQEIERDNCQFAVVIAQAACELGTEDAINEVMSQREVDYLTDAVLDMCGTVSLANPQLRKLFKALTGADPAAEPWWPAWMDARKMRHEVAHGGRTVTRDQALACVDAATKFIAHVSEKVAIVRMTT